MAQRPTYYDYIRSLANRMTVEYVSSNAQLLYHTLLMLNNTAHWETWFPCTDYYISNLMHMGVKAFKTARNHLKQLGAIDFEISKKRGECTRYRVCDEFCNVVCTYPTQQQTTHQTALQTAHQTTHQTTHQTAPYIKKKKKEEKEDINPLIPFTGKLGEKVGEWLSYKKEKGQSYKPTGLKSLITKIEKAVDAYGEPAVITAIDKAMSNSWQGFFPESVSTQKPQTVYTDNSGFDYDNLDELMKGRYSQ